MPNQNTNNSNESKKLFYASIVLFAVPVVLLAASVSGLDQSGLMSTSLLFLVGLPSVLVGAGLLVASFSASRKEALAKGPIVDSKKAKVIKGILTTVIVAALSVPVIFVIYAIILFAIYMIQRFSS